MAEVDVTPRFGAELKDGFKPVNAWVSGGIAWLEDVQNFYRERAAIEKDYSVKLNGLARKYFEKKAKRTSTLSVGDTPTVTPGSLESASMTTWSVQLSTLEQQAAEHDRFATQLIQNLAEPLRQVANRYEELRKSHGEYAVKLEKERDVSYAELKKMKGKYDSVCSEVESRRKKQEGSDNASKARAAYQQQVQEMNNIKNTYIISINVTNRQKERYYNDYVPDLLDSLQDLSETRVARLNAIWTQAAQIETATLSKSSEYLAHLLSEIPRNDPSLDSMMFVRHNISNWQPPTDFAFEPSPVWHDDDQMMTDETAKVFLRNLLTKSKSSLGELRKESDSKRREVDGVKKVRDNVRAGRDKRDEVEIVRSIFQLQEQLHEADRKKSSAEVEISTITAVVGDLSRGARNHNFKAQTFKIPTNCDLCGDRIWGLSAKGFDCQDCGFTCHSKCELKVPADCPGETSKEGRKKLKAERQAAANAVPESNGDTLAPESSPGASRSGTIKSISSMGGRRSVSSQPVTSPGTVDEEDADDNSTAAAPPTAAPKPAAVASKRHRMVAPPPSAYVASPPPDSSDPRGKMLYAYQENGEGEVTVSEGETFTILEGDDGGWTKIRTSNGDSGLVPTSYLEMLPPELSFSNKPNASSLSLASDGVGAARPGSTYSEHSDTRSMTGSTASGGGVKKKGPAVAPKRGAKLLKYVEALYDYEARGDGEVSMVEGERMVVIVRDAGDGWAEVEKGGIRGSVPANYVKDV